MRQVFYREAPRQSIASLLAEFGTCLLIFAALFAVLIYGLTR